MKGWRAAAAAVGAAVLGANAWRIASHQGAPSFDDAWYLEVSFRLLSAADQGPAALAQAWTEAFRIKAPLLSLLPLPLYAVFGPGEKVALWVQQASLVLGWASVYGLGRRLYGEKAALAAVCAAALTPLLYGLSRVFLVECVLTTLVVAFHWAVLELRPERPRDGVLLGLLFGLGLLCKITFPLYVAGILFLERDRFRRDSTVAAGLAASILAGSWYAFNLPYVLGFAWSAGFGRIAKDYGGSVLASPGLALAFWKGAGREALSFPFLLASVALAALAWRLRRAGWTPGRAEFLLASWFLLPAAVFTLGVNKEIRYLAPVLPAACLALGAAAAWAAERGAGLLVALCLLLPMKVLATQTLGLPPGAALIYNGPPDRDPGWDRAAVLESLRLDAGAGPAVAAVAYEHPAFNANNLASLAAARGMRLSFVSLGYAQTSLEAALIRMKEKDVRYLVLVAGHPAQAAPGFLNVVNDGVAALAGTARLPARRLGLLALAPGMTAVLYRLERRE